jgi:hypothetical protein
MTSPQDAMIYRLKEVGLMGIRRDVAKVDTVIAFRKYIDYGNGITGFDGYVAIYRKHDAWMIDIGVDGDSYSSHENAVERAIQILNMNEKESSELFKYFAKRIQERA